MSWSTRTFDVLKSLYVNTNDPSLVSLLNQPINMLLNWYNYGDDIEHLTRCKHYFAAGRTDWIAADLVCVYNRLRLYLRSIMSSKNFCELSVEVRAKGIAKGGEIEVWELIANYVGEKHECYTRGVGLAEPVTIRYRLEIARCAM